ncbi:MAG: hypothetical protein QOH69_1363 [Actinomycetota bacterium]|nr:hypothetical protein [Actinomycetota bacterium]
MHVAGLLCLESRGTFVPGIGASGFLISGCSVDLGWGLHSMLNTLIALVAVGAVVFVALLGRRFIDVDDAEQSLMAHDDDERGWVPTGVDELALEQTRCEMTGFVKASGLPY